MASRRGVTHALALRAAPCEGRCLTWLHMILATTMPARVRSAVDRVSRWIRSSWGRVWPYAITAFGFALRSSLSAAMSLVSIVAHAPIRRTRSMSMRCMGSATRVHPLLEGSRTAPRILCAPAYCQGRSASARSARRIIETPGISSPVQRSTSVMNAFTRASRVSLDRVHLQ